MPRWSRTSSDGRGSSALNCSKRPPCLPLRPPNRNFVVPDHRHFPSVAMGEPLPLCASRKIASTIHPRTPFPHPNFSFQPSRQQKPRLQWTELAPPVAPSSAEAHWEGRKRRRMRPPLRKNRRALTKAGRLKPGLQPRGPLRKNRGALTKGGRLKPGLQRRGPLRKNRGALSKGGRLKPGLQPRGPLRKNRRALTKAGRLKPGLQPRGLLRKNRGALTKGTARE